MNVFISFLFLIVAIDSIAGHHIHKEFHQDGIHFISKHRKTPFLTLNSNNWNGSPTLCEGRTPDEECLIWPNGGIMFSKPMDESGTCTYNIVLNTTHQILTLPNDDVQRYGGPENFVQRWPINPLRFSNEAYVTQQNGNQGITESYWLTSKGEALFIYNSPAFLTQNETHFIYEAKLESPYPVNNPFDFTFVTCIGTNIRNAHELILQNNLIAKPAGVPDARMITHPIWSTWARYKADINSELVQTFANEILNHGFNNSQLEIDDKWETCYGSLTFDTNRFPDIKQLTDDLKSQGFRVTLWVHPFINLDCPTRDEALEKNYFVSTRDGNTNTNWWNGEGGIVDMTNPEAADWWAARVKALQDQGIDSFKFDAGETSWMPENRYLSHVDDILQPSEFTRAYVRKCAEFGNMVEVRSAAQTQDLNIFVRMLDKDTRWDIENGLKSLITTLLVMNIQGYPLVLPDMIGGNGYNDLYPSKELFIRWLQANTFMPSLQFSYVPWDYDDETVEISKKYTELHAQYSDKIIELAKKATEDGTPINLPLWWIAPTDEETFNIADQYLLGEDLLVAPVVEDPEDRERTRDIYLPQGRWRDELRNTEIVGPQWLRNYTVELDELAYFTRINE